VESDDKTEEMVSRLDSLVIAKERHRKKNGRKMSREYKSKLLLDLLPENENINYD